MISLNEEFEQALRNPMIRRVMSVASRGFRKLDSEVKESCVQIALWESIRDYDGTKEMKFTSYLHMKIRWQCLQELKAIRYNRRYLRKYSPFCNFSRDTLTEILSFRYNTLSDITLELTPSENKLFSSRFIELKSLEEIAIDEGVSAQAVHKRVDKIKKKIDGILTH